MKEKAELSPNGFFMRANKGFSLVELLIGLAIGSIVIGGVYASYQVVQNQYEKLSAKAEMHQVGRVSMEVLERDIRMAGYTHRGSTGAYQFGAISQDPLLIDSDGRGVKIIYDYQDPSTNAVERRRITYRANTYTNNKGSRFRLYKTVDVLSPTARSGTAQIFTDYLDDFFISQGGDGVSQGMVACWGFNGDLTDQIAGHDGQAKVSVGYTAGALGQALNLTGSSHVEVPHHTDLNLNKSLSMSFFIKPVANPSACGGSRKPVIVVMKGTHNPNNYSMTMDGKNLNSIWYQQYPKNISNPTPYSWWTDVNIPTDRYSHVVMNRSPSNVEIFFNGARLSGNNAVPNSTDAHLDTGPLFIGWHGSGHCYAKYRGAIDDLRLYNRPLTSAEVSAIASNKVADCGSGTSRLVNVSMIFRSKDEIGSSKVYTPPAYVKTASVKGAPDKYLREEFSLSILPRNTQ